MSSPAIIKKRRLPHVLPLAVALVLAVGPVACTSSDRAAQESFELATFEERQGNLDHAGQLYRQILARHPDTEWAQKAQARLDALSSSSPAP